MPQVDTLRAIFTYLIALVVVVGGGYIIYISRGDPAATDTVAITAGFVGSALTFAFGAEVQARTARQSASATAASVAATAAATDGHPADPVPPLHE